MFADGIVPVEEFGSIARSLPGFVWRIVPTDLVFSLLT